MYRYFSMFCRLGECNCDCGYAASGLTVKVQNPDGVRAGNAEANEDNPAFRLGVAVRVAMGVSGTLC